MSKLPLTDSHRDAKLIKLDVFGRHVLAERTDYGWQMYYISREGKRRPADDLMVPSFVTESEIERFLADLCHEWETMAHSEVRRLE